MESRGRTLCAGISTALLLASCDGVGPIKGDLNDPPRKILGKNAPDTYGIALAGGGTKAASYGMGVLAAAVEDEKFFGEVGAISTVSGGGYAAFFLYSKLLVQKTAGEQHLSLRDFFRDCIPATYQNAELGGVANAGTFCKKRGSAAEYRFQQWVRCRQDVLEQTCDADYEGTDTGRVTNTAAILLQTGLALLPNFVARSIFDWPVNLSPSRVAYRDGIGTTYGLYPTTRWSAGDDVGAACAAGEFVNCRSDSLAPRVAQEKLTWKHLEKLHERRRVPVWVTNMTGSRSRSIFGWARDGMRNFSLYPIQKSAYGSTHGYRGPIEFPEDFQLLDSVGSAAAFFDSNGNSGKQPLRMGLAILQHLFAFDWGSDVRNPQVEEPYRRYLHLALPFPLYYADGTINQLLNEPEQAARKSGAYIRLMDGGNDDNLGAYTLLQQKFKTIFIADHAQDRYGELDDLCRLDMELQRGDSKRRVREDENGTRRRLWLPGLKDFDKACQRWACGLEPEEKSWRAKSCAPKQESSPRHYYPIWAWKHPFLVGCISTDSDCKEGEGTSRVVVLKPALDLAQFRKLQLETDRLALRACGQDAEGSLLPCETSAYLVRMLLKNPGAVPAFPQDGTASVTFDSNGLQYAAYRDLAAWQMRQAKGRVTNLDYKGFMALMKLQSNDPICPTVLPFDVDPTDEVKTQPCTPAR